MIEIEIIKLPHPVMRQLPQNILTGMLFAGDRISCCTHAAVACDGSSLRGLATIAPDGEQFSGKPTIVGLYVFPQHRGRLIGKRLLVAAIDWMVGQQLTPIHVDAMSSSAARLIDLLPEKQRSHLQVSDHFGILDVFQNL